MSTDRGIEAEGGADSQARLMHALSDSAAHRTRAGRMIAAYLRDHLDQVPYESGAVLAGHIGVSEMTLIRFLREIGFDSLKDLKDALRLAGKASTISVDDRLERFRLRREGLGSLNDSLSLELRAVALAYELTRLDRWQTVVDLLSQRAQIAVAGFQASKGLALDFASRLKYARGGVQFAEGTTGVYSSVLELEPQQACVVLIDTVAYARKGMLLARQVQQIGIPLVIVTDNFSNWGYEFTELVLQGHTQVNTFWDSSASLSVILNLLINAVASARGPESLRRFEMMRELGDIFNEFK